MVFIGAFFLMNLTLAVINASFTRSQNEMKQQEREKRRFEDVGSPNQQDDNNGADSVMKTRPVEEIGVSEFFIAKRAARKMIEFLRAR